MKNISITKSDSNEITKLVETMKDAFTDDSILYGEPPYGDNPIYEIEININENQCYSFYYDKELIGGMYLKQLDADEYRLKRIWIDRKNQNKGIGTILLKEIEKMITGCKRLSLDTPYKSFRNHHFYEKNGFIKMGKKKPTASKLGKLDSNFTLFEYMKIV